MNRLLCCDDGRSRAACRGLLGRAALFAALLLTAGGLSAAQAQVPGIFFGNPDDYRGEFELAEGIEVEEVDASAQQALARAETLVGAAQWDQAAQIYGELLASAENKLVPLGPWRYLGLREYCRARLAEMPSESLTAYRAKIDPAAQHWYEEALAARDPALLARVVDLAPASRWAEEALWTLGDWRLERGEFAAARQAWRQLLPPGDELKAATTVAVAENAPAALAAAPPPKPELPKPESPAADLRLRVVATTHRPADVRARLTLVSILEGSAWRARDELQAFRVGYPAASGPMGGSEVDYADFLTTLLEQSADWPNITARDEWPTFAGNQERDGTARAFAAEANAGETATTPATSATKTTPPAWRIAWRIAMPGAPPAAAETAAPAAAVTRAAAPPSATVASPPPSPFYPIATREAAFVATPADVVGVRLVDGQPLWPRAPTTIYRDAAPAVAAAVPPALVDARMARTFGMPAFTLNATPRWLLARLGDGLTGEPFLGGEQRRLGRVVCLDLAAQARLAWHFEPEPGWAVDGAPICNDRAAFVALRWSRPARTGAYVVRLDLQSGRVEWRRFVCAADVPAHETGREATHNLLALEGDRLYFNTNLGAVAALRADSGEIAWLQAYPRQLRGNLSRLRGHWRRDPSPCLCQGGQVLAAPRDSTGVFAYDSLDGRLLWQTGDKTAEVRQLLGTAENAVVAATDRGALWIALAGPQAGEVVRSWPPAERSEEIAPSAGRGLIFGDAVLFPTRDTLYAMDARSAELRATLDLKRLGVTGGNLAAAVGRLVIANAAELVCIEPGEPPRAAP